MLSPVSAGGKPWTISGEAINDNTGFGWCRFLSIRAGVSVGGGVDDGSGNDVSVGAGVVVDDGVGLIVGVEVAEVMIVSVITNWCNNSPVWGKR